MERTIICIDLKSFFASVECVNMGLDPYKTPLVVASKKQGNGAITLAITPYLKSLGVKSRSRLYEIPNNIKYQIVEPKMHLYKEYSKKVMNIFLEFVSKEDLYIYSIDEAFLDVTDYFNFYKIDEVSLAQKIIDTIYKKTKLTASCGIGPNLFLAKVAMDNDSKKRSNYIARWTKDNFKTYLYQIYPLSNIWGIGKAMEKKLNNLGIFTPEELVNYNNVKLNKFLGVHGHEMREYLSGNDKRIIKNLNSEEAPDKSYSQSNTFLNDKDLEEVFPILNDMTEDLSSKLRNNNLECFTITLKISFSREFDSSFYKSYTLEKSTSNTLEIFEICNEIIKLNKFNDPIRKIELHLSNFTPKSLKQLDLFSNEENKIDKAVDKINSKFGTKVITNAINVQKKDK